MKNNYYNYIDENGDYVDYWTLVNDINNAYEHIKKIEEENQQLKDNWNELKKLLNQKYYNGERIDIKDILDKMQELEKGSNSND